MFGSLKLGRPFGIDVNVHGTFWLLPLFVLFTGAAGGDLASAGFQVALVFAVFGCVALHEFGHALAAAWFGVRTRDITLYPIGGVASLERMPERPLAEIVIALAGPAVNLLIAAGLFAAVLAGNFLVPEAWSGSAADDVATLFVGRLFAANLFLAVFNLLPAFPMDGGRVLRAVLSLGMSRLSATRAAAGVGAVVAAGLFLWGLYEPRFTLMLLAGFVFVLGQAELAAVRAQQARRGCGRLWDPFGERTARPRAEPFTGWRYDPFRRVWALYEGGLLIREVRV